MFATPSTPVSQTRSSTWPGYNNNMVGSTPMSTPNIPNDPSFPSLRAAGITTQHSLSLDDVAVERSSRDYTITSTPPRQTGLLASNTTSPSPALSHSSPLGITDETIQTPFVFRNSSYAIDPLLSPTPVGRSLTYKEMSYPNTPSPPATYGINGGMIVQEPASMMQSNNHHTSCTPLSHPPSDNLLFSSQSKHPRPALRPSLSHNAVYHSPTPIWSRRGLVGSNTVSEAVDEILTPSNTATPATQPVPINTPARPSTAGTILDVPVTQYPPPPPPPALSSSAPSANGIPTQSHPGHPATTAHHQNQGHEAATPFTTLSSSSGPVNHPHHHPHSTPTSYQPTLTSSNVNTPYSDELSFHTSSYQPSYDTSFSSSGTSGSPWAPSTTLAASAHSPHIQQHVYVGQGHHMYTMYPSGKQIEPILAPGEVPAPRPPMSYAALIGEALLLAPPPHHLYVSEISDSIKKRYAYYRQNPSKIYNGVRHQTSMCKAFVKLARPFGDQSGGARKWAIRAGCETWFQNGGYHPPGTLNSPTSRPKGGKAKATARSKALAIGTSPPADKKMLYDDGPWSAGPSSGPAYDGSGRPFVSYPQPVPSYATPSYLPPGYHYLPVAAHGHPVPHPSQAHQVHQTHGHAPVNGQPPMYMSSWGPFSAPPPPQPAGLGNGAPQSWTRIEQHGSSPDQWQEEHHATHQSHQSAPSEHGSHASYEDHPHSPVSMRGTHSPDRR